MEIPQSILEKLNSIPTPSKKLNKEQTVKAEVDSFNSIVGEIKGYDCKECKNKGVIAKANSSNNGVVLTVCGCQKIRHSLKRIRESGIPNDKTLDNFEVTAPFQRAMLELAKGYVNKSTNEWLYIGGTVGSGKTHICSCIARELIMRDSLNAVYVNWREDNHRLKSYEDRTLVNEAKSCDLLYIDDLFKGENVTPADLNVAYDIINHRYNEKLRTIISGEKSIANIYQLESAIGGRIYEMCSKFNLFIAYGEDRDYRKKGLKSV